MNDYVDIDEQTEKRDSSVVGIGEWILAIILFGIPVVNIIYFIYLVASKKVNESKRNYALAKIIIVIVSYILVYLIGGSILLYLSSHYGNALTALIMF